MKYLFIILSALIIFSCSELDPEPEPFVEKIATEDKITCTYFDENDEESGVYEDYVFKVKISEDKTEKFIEITTKESDGTGSLKNETFKGNVEYVKVDNLVEFYHSTTYQSADEDELEISTTIYDMKTILDLKNLKSKQIYEQREDRDPEILELYERYDIDSDRSVTESGTCERLEMKDGWRNLKRSNGICEQLAYG